MKLLTKEQKKQLYKNGLMQNGYNDHYPVAKFFIPEMDCSFLLTQILDDYPDSALCLHDLELDDPQLDILNFSKLKEILKKEGKSLVRDENFKARFPMSVYARKSREMNKIVEPSTKEIFYDNFLMLL